MDLCPGGQEVVRLHAMETDTRRAWRRMQDILFYTRWAEWYPGKVPLLLSVALLAKLKNPAALNVWDLLTWYGGVVAFLAFAYMVNNVSDRYIDRLAGKAVHLADWTVRAKVLLISGVGASGVALALLRGNWRSVVGWSFCYMLACGYSWPPRWKEDPALGPIVASAGQMVAPAAVLVWITDTWSLALLAYLLLLFFFGLRMILLHQLLDRACDSATGVRTTVLVMGPERSVVLLKVFFAMECACLAAGVSLWWKWLWTPIIPIVFGLPALHVLGRYRLGLPVRLTTYEYIPMADILEFSIPTLLSLSLVSRDGLSQLWFPVVCWVPFVRRHWLRAEETVSIIWGAVHA